VTFEEMEQAFRQRLQALPSGARAELIHVLRLPDFDRADRIGEFCSYPQSRSFGESLIDLEEDGSALALPFSQPSGSGRDQTDGAWG
jgi:hypothetical protein